MRSRAKTVWRRLRARRDRGRRAPAVAPAVAPAARPEPEPAPQPEPAPEARVDVGYVEGWHRLVRAVDPAAAGAAPDPTAYDAGLTRRTAELARSQAAQAQLVRGLAAGDPMEAVVRRSVDALARLGSWNDALALCDWVGSLPGLEDAGRIGRAVVAHRRRQHPRTWRLVRELPRPLVVEHLALEAVDTALLVGTDESRAWARDLVEPTDVLGAHELVGLAGRFLATGDRDLAARLAAAARARDEADLDEQDALSLRLVEGWLADRPAVVPDGAVALGVIDYQSPDQTLASGNLGDYVQTLALLGNLARLSRVRFTGDDGLGELLTELQGRVRPRLRLEEPPGAVHLLPVHRDFSSGDDLPERTWLVAFGWHMHPVYDLVHDFPYHPRIRPVFVSFHVNRLDMLSDAALDYLRTHGPVGCRDWATVFLLLGAGVDAFFTGCMTSTLDAVFPRRDRVHHAPEGTAPIATIDVPLSAAGAGSARTRSYTHQGDEYREMSLVEGTRAASDLLAHYQETLDSAVTRRLHAYLPLTALGVPVRFRPWYAGDVRFNGLAGLTPGSERLQRMQRTIRRLVAETLTDVVAGHDDETVYAGWRERTAPLVEAARRRFEAEPAALDPFPLDVPALVEQCRTGSRRLGPHDAVDPAAVTDVVLAFDHHLAPHAPGTLESIVANASGPLRVWLLARGLSPAYVDWLGGAFPDVPLTVVPCDHVDFGDVARMPERITVSTMDRLLLPELLADVDRAVYIDIDTVVLGDVCELARTDLGDTPAAARDALVSAASEWRQAARRLPGPTALELQRRTDRAHGLHGAALNAGVLVLDLARMRADAFTETYLPWVTAYGLHDQDVVLAYLGPRRTVLEPRWNAMPALEDVEDLDPAVVHWAELPKPWEQRPTWAPHLWRTYADRVAARAGRPPDC